jgi:hypothetical protein
VASSDPGELMSSVGHAADFNVGRIFHKWTSDYTNIASNAAGEPYSRITAPTSLAKIPSRSKIVRNASFTTTRVPLSTGSVQPRQPAADARVETTRLPISRRLARAAMEKVSAKQEQKLSNFGDGLTVNGKNKWNQYNDLYLTIPPGLLRAGRRSRSVGAA